MEGTGPPPPPPPPPAAPDPVQMRQQAEVARVDPPQDPSGRALVTRRLLLSQVPLAVVVVILEALYLGKLADTPDEEWATSTELTDFAVVVGLGYGLQFVMLLVTAGFFIAWIHRAYKNAHGLGALSPRLGSGWAIGGWFLPLAWFVIPKMVVNDTWRGSDPRLGAYADAHEWQDLPVPAVLMVWWLMFNAWNIASNVAGRLAWSVDSEESDRAATIFSMATAPLMIAAALLAMYVVRIVTDRQTARAAAREQMAPPAAVAHA